MTSVFIYRKVVKEMYKVKLYPYKWAKICFSKIYFGTDWKEVQKTLGKPQRRYMEIGSNDFNYILIQFGKHRWNYRNRKPIKGDFVEDRDNIRFVYKDYKLCSLEVIGRGAVHLDDEYLKLNIPLNERTDEDAIYDEIFEKMKVCILQEFGMIIKLYGNTTYNIYEKNEFEEDVKSYRMLFDVSYKN